MSTTTHGGGEAVLQIPIAKIEPSPSNPRKTFPRGELEEMAVTIRERGVLVPIKVRPHPEKNHGSYELVDGECRWRASQIAGCSNIPALVEELDDKAVLEHQLIANSQRIDVHPIEEGDAYKRLLDEHGYTMDQLIAKTGKSRSHLYGRLRMTELAPAVRKATLDGKLPATHAELIGRIPDEKLQAQCLKEVLGEKLDYDAVDELDEIGVRHESVGDEGKRGGGKDNPQALSFRATQALIRRRYMTKLALATFNPTAAELVPAAGSCTVCPHRSGNQPELPGLVSKSEDLCTKPTCFEDKTRAQFKVTAAAAKERGVEVLSKKDAESVFDYTGVDVNPNADYVDLKSQLPWNLAKGGKQDTFGKLLGKHAAEIPRVLVQDESGAPRELLDKKKAIAKLKELGKVDAPEKPKKKDKAKQAKPDLKLAKSALGRLVYAMRFAVLDAPATKDLPWTRWIALVMLGQFGAYHTGVEFVLDKRFPKGLDEMLKYVENAKTSMEIRALLVEVLVADMGDAIISGYPAESDKDSFAEACKIGGLDWKKIQADTKKDAETAAAALKKKDTARAMDGKDCGAMPSLKLSKIGDACIHDLGHDGPHSNGKQTWGDKKPAKKKAGAK